MLFRACFTLLCISVALAIELKYTSRDGYEYDISALTNQDYSVTDTSTGIIFQFRLGGPLTNSPCIGTYPQTAVCARFSNGSTEPAGMSDQVVYTDNARTDAGFRGTFSGGSNCSNKARSTVIGLVCSDDQSITVLTDEEACNVGIVFRSPEACPRANKTPGFHLNTCSYVIEESSRKLSYDFMPLMKKELSFTVNGKTVYLTLCKKSFHCNGEMTACEVSGATNRGLGKVDTYVCSTTENDEKLIFSIEEGDATNGNKASAAIFLNYNALTDGIITKAYSQDIGSYVIVVESRHAKPVIEENETIFDVANCKFTTADSQVYDLSPLTGFLINYDDPLFKNTFRISTCGTCGNGDNTFCLRTYNNEEVGVGRFDTLSARELTFYDSGVIMSAGNGDLCPDNVTRRKSVVTYKCTDDPEPTVTEMYQGNCHYFATVSTRHACKVPQ